MNIKYLHLPLFILLLLFTTSQLLSQNPKQWLKREFKHITIEDKLWIGTPNGLYQYHPEEDSWSVYGEHNGLPANKIKQIQWDGEFLIVATSKGVAFGDINLNKWLNYNKENGLPSNNVLSIAYQEDYIWVGTDKGAARFDKLIQEWEIFGVNDGLPDSVIYDIVTDGDLVYFAGPKGLTEYDVNFEKWRYYDRNDGIAADTIRFIYPMSDYLWLFTNQGPTRFSKKLHSTLSFTENTNLNYSNIIDFEVDGEQFWITTPMGVFIYNPASNLWRHFQEEINLPDINVKSLAFSQAKRWFVTEQGIAEFDETIKNWQHYNKTHGLSADQYENVIIALGKVFLINRSTIDYFDQSENRWIVYPLQGMLKSGDEDKPEFSIDKEKGTFVQFSPEVRFSLSGSRFNYRFQNNYEYNYATDDQNSLSEDFYRGDLKAQLTLPNDRTISAFYDNTDISQVVYGLQYKGIKGDLVQEANWGDIRHEQGKSHLMPSLGVFGVSARLEAGKKTERYKRSLFSAKGFSGEQTTDQEREFFTGNFESSNIILKDIDYVKNLFFRIDTTDILFPVEEGSEKIYIDDLISGNNTVNTLENHNIAGLTGDFDKVQEYIGYRMNYDKGIIQFLEPIAESSTIVITGISNGIPFEKVIKKSAVINQALVNRYFVGGIEITPYTFELNIFDNQNNKHTLSEFGLDADNDNRIDPEWINYQEGILTFPDPHPFPSPTYDPNNPTTQYSMQIQFKSEITIFILTNTNLIRGSETVAVDGEILTPGEDYVLDYTSGTLLILKEGIIAEDSETEVYYEYYRDTEEQFHNTGIVFGPSDNAIFDVNFSSFDEKQPDSSIARVDGINVFSELKFQFENVDFKFTPEFSRSKSGTQEGNAFLLRGDISSRKIRLFSIFESYDKQYKSLVPTKFKLGKIQDRIAIGGTYYPLDYLDVNVNWKKTRSPIQSNGKENIEEELNGKILFSKNLYPALSLSARHRTLNSEDYNSDKKTVKGNLEYNLSPKVLKNLSLKSMRIYAVWRRSWEDINANEEFSLFSDSKKVHDNQYLRLDVSPMDLVQLSSYYRGRTTTAKGVLRNGEDQLQNRNQKMFLDATIDRINGLNMNMRYQAEIGEHFIPSQSSIRNLSLYRNLQSTVRFFPGRWISLLSPFTFEVSYQPTWRGSLRNFSRELTWSEKYFNCADINEIISSEDNKLYQFRSEWRPLASFFINSNHEFYKIKSNYLDSQLLTTIIKSNYKIEFRPTMNFLITLQYNHNDEDKLDYSNRVQNNPLLWLENRWTENLQTKLNVSYLHNRLKMGRIEEYYSTFSPSLGFTYRIFQTGSRLIKMEIRDDISFTSYRGNNSSNSFDYNSYSNSISFDYFPLSILILRFRFGTTYKNILYSDQDILDNTTEFRLTAQF